MELQLFVPQGLGYQRPEQIYNFANPLKPGSLNHYSLLSEEQTFKTNFANHKGKMQQKRGLHMIYL